MNLANSLSTAINNNSDMFNNMSTNKLELQQQNNESFHNESVWILRDDLNKSLINTTTTTLTTTKNNQKQVPSSCLKNKLKNQKSNKFVHYAPLLSQGN